MSKVHDKAKARDIEDNELEQNFEYSVNLMRRLLAVIGLQPFASANYPAIVRILYIVAVWFFLISFTVPYCLFIALVIKDYKTRVRSVGPLSYAFMVIFKYSTVLLQESQLREFGEWMTADWRSVRSRIESNLMLENAKSGKTFAMIYVIYMYVSGLTYGAFFSFAMDPIVVNNRTTRVFAYPSYFIFFDSHEHFKKVYTLHVMCAFIQFTITNAVASLSISCVMHVCGQIAATSWMLQNLGSGTFDKTTFGSIIEKHLRAITFAKKLERYLSSICMIELTGCCFNICMLCYYIITEHDQGSIAPYIYSVLLVSFTYNIFIFCYIGDRLKEKCNSIASVAYNVDWYHLSPKDARNLIMIITSTQHPIVLTAGKLATMSMTCFTSVMKASFSYLNMLRTVTNQ